MDLQNRTNCCNSDCCEEEDTVGYYLLPTLYSVFFVVGLPANCMSLYVASLQAKRGNNMAVYLVNLSVSDLLYIVSLPVWIQLALQCRSVGDTLCSIVAFVMNNSFYVGTGFLCCISVDRYLAVVFPLYFPRARTMRTAIVVSAVVWCTELPLHVLLLSHTGALGAFSSSRTCVEKTPMRLEDSHMALVRVALGYLFPLLLMTFCFLQIFRAVQVSVFTVETDRRKIQSLLLLLLLTYVVAFTPYQTVMFLRGLWEPGECSFALRMKDAYMVCVAVTTLNSVVDPIIYCLLSESARIEMNLLLQQCRRRFETILSLRKNWKDCFLCHIGEGLPKLTKASR
ncbi:G-protein coupled receptor 4-like [Megalops cyprinoides]|uniref:G-protein coupled receptor 4-like n=1 Tax=Megalops cyprinoides TaxID=118141 RepID=UPI0018641507|nr:G-protein coupled receptor 4-like [Megalops cyprinoides]